MIQTRNKRKLAVYSTLAVSTLLGSAFLFPKTTDNALADARDVRLDVPMDVNVHVETALSLAADQHMDITISSSEVATQTFKTATSTVYASTNSPSGYALYLSDFDNNTDLKHSKNAAPITSLDYKEGGYTDSTFTNGSWGFKSNGRDFAAFNGTNWQAIPALGAATRSLLNHSDGPINLDPTTVSVATKLDVYQPSGDYIDRLLISAVARDDGYTPTEWDNMHYMHEMTTSICSSVSTPSKTAAPTEIPMKELMDFRDGKTYVISKLADGNCWMSQNLDLDLGTVVYGADGTTAIHSTVALNNSYTDLNTKNEWIPSVSTDKVGAARSWVADANIPNSYDPGEIYYHTSGSTSNDTSSNTGARQEHAGNYYSWNAATAGSGDASTAAKVEAGDSICPKGWQLPSYTGSKSFQNLISTTYGLSGAAGVVALREAPLQFVRAGYHYTSGTGLLSLGSYGDYWSSTASSGTDAYYLDFDGSYFYPQGAYPKTYGFSVRCVAR